MADYEKAIKRPFQDINKLIIGSFLSIIPILNLLVTGYFVDSAKNTMKKKDAIPEWDNWAELFIKGLSVAIIGLIYSLPALVLLFLGGGILVTVITDSMLARTMPALIAGGGLLVLAGLFFLLLSGLIVPMALMSFIDKGNFGDAFAFGKILRKVFTMQYLVPWLVVLVYSAVASILFLEVPLVGYAIASFVVGMTAFTVFAEVYTEIK